jgi:hypothetical protein
MEEYEGEGVLQGSEWDAEQLLSDLTDSVRRNRLQPGSGKAWAEGDAKDGEGEGGGWGEGLMVGYGGKEEGKVFKHRWILFPLPKLSLSASVFSCDYKDTAPEIRNPSSDA